MRELDKENGVKIKKGITMQRINELRNKKPMSRIYELGQIPVAERSAADVAELSILNATADKKREYEIAVDNLAKATAFKKSEEEKVIQLEGEVLPRLNREYNAAVGRGSKLKDLQRKITEAETSLNFAKKWLTGKNIEPNEELKPRYAPSEADLTIEATTTARDKAKNLYRNKMQQAFMNRMELLCKRADDGMVVLFEAFEDKHRVIQRCSSILPGFTPPVPNPVQVSGFIAGIYRDQAKKIRYQQMCGLFPRAVMAGKHEFERMLREDRNKAEAAHNREYLGRKKAFVSNAVRIFKSNNPDADFRSAQMQKLVKQIETGAAARYLAEHPQKPFVYDPPKYEPVAESEKIDTLDDFRKKVVEASEKAKAKEKADIAAGRAVPQTRRKPNLVVTESKGFAPSKKERDIEREKAAIKAAESSPSDEDEFACGLTAKDML